MSETFAPFDPEVDPEADFNRARTEEYLRDKERLRFWQNILGSAIGRRELWNIVGVMAHAFETRFACGPNGFPQDQATWHALGEQQLGQQIFAFLQLQDFDNANLMQFENDPRCRKPPRDSE